jgi:hypothetical protein
MQLTLAQMDASTPEANWSDDNIVQWARRRGLDRWPKASCSLFGAVRESDPDTVLIHFDKPGIPVERFKGS